MESLTKNKKTDSEIVRLFEQSRCFDGAVVSISELTKGSFNAVYHITLSNGAHYVLKIAPHSSTPVLRNEKNILKAEAEALRLIQSRTSVPVPEVLYYSEGASFCDSPFLIMQFISGEEYQQASMGCTDEAKDAILTQLGAMTREFHQIHGAGFGGLGSGDGQCSTWSKAFTTLFQNVLEDGIDADVSLPFEYEYVSRLAERVRPFLNDVETPSLVHGDLWLGNVLIQRDTITALLDFERSLWGDPLMEYPFGLLRNNAPFLKGYRQTHPDQSDISQKMRRALYNLYHYLIVLIEKPYRGFPQGNSNYFVSQKMMAQAKALEALFEQ